MAKVTQPIVDRDLIRLCLFGGGCFLALFQCPPPPYPRLLASRKHTLLLVWLCDQGPRNEVPFTHQCLGA